MLSHTPPIVFTRLILRLLMIPFLYIKLITNKVSKKNCFQILYDLIYLFFKMKTFPDNYGPCRLWELNRKDWALYYGSSYHPFQRARLRKLVQRYPYQILFNDKVVCTQLFQDPKIKMPKTVGMISTEDNFAAKLTRLFIDNNAAKFIIKPVLGSGGMGIVIALKNERNEIVIKNQQEQISIERYVLKQNVIVQEIVEQHPQIAAVSQSSLNTIRVVTLLTKSEMVLIVSAAMRFSSNESFVDNWSAGGIAVGVNVYNGTLKKYAFDKNGLRFTKHPVSDILFEDFQIPQWEAVLNLAVKIQKASPFYRLIGMDIAIDNFDNPLLIEVNANPDLIFQEQTSGPLFQDVKVLKAFDEYNLLVCKEHKKLLHATTNDILPDNKVIFENKSKNTVPANS